MKILNKFDRQSLSKSLKENNQAAFQEGLLSKIKESTNVTQFAKDAGLTRNSIYKALGPKGNPHLGTIFKIMSALGVRFKAKGKK